MLAQNFKTSSELGISDKEIEALIKVLGVLERGEVKHVIPSNFGNEPQYEAGFTGHFNMIRVAVRESCGTVACILGTARLLCGIDLFPSWESGDMEQNLKDLFWPIHMNVRFLDVTPAQAATAVRNYLTTGEPCWDEACSA